MSIVIEGMQEQNVTLPLEDGTAGKLRPPRRPELVEAEERLKAERVQERLRQEAPGWRLINSGTGINRTREFPEARVAMAYASYVSVLATYLRLPVSVLLSGTRTVITLQGRRRGKRRGVTDPMVDFAAAIG